MRTAIEPKLLTVREVAQFYRIAPATIRALCRLGKLKHIKRPSRGCAGETVYVCAKSASSVLGVGS